MRSGRGSRTSRRNARPPRGRRGAYFPRAIAPVLRRGVRCVIKARAWRRQFEDRLEVEPVADVLGRGIGRQRPGESSRAWRPRRGQDGRNGGIIGRHHRIRSKWGETRSRSRGSTCSAAQIVRATAGGSAGLLSPRSRKPAISLPYPAQTRRSRPPPPDPCVILLNSVEQFDKDSATRSALNSIEFHPSSIEL
jgi:hypothetical protein